MSRVVLQGVAIAGIVAFVMMVKLMHDISRDMARMTQEVARMTEQVATMSADVGRMTGHMQALTVDVGAMRASMDRMSSVVQTGSQQIQQMNPMEMMKGVVPGSR